MCSKDSEEASMDEAQEGEKVIEVMTERQEPAHGFVKLGGCFLLKQ